MLTNAFKIIVNKLLNEIFYTTFMENIKNYLITFMILSYSQ